MLFGLFVLLVCQLIGEIVARVLGLSLPGPVIGIPLLLAFLYAQWLWRRQAPPVDGENHEGAVGKAADSLIACLGLVFVPAGVGVVQHVDLMLANGGPLLIALIGSAVLTLVVTVGVFRLARCLVERGRP